MKVLVFSIYKMLHNKQNNTQEESTETTHTASHTDRFEAQTS